MFNFVPPISSVEDIGCAKKSLYFRLRKPCNESPQKLYNGLRDTSQRHGSVPEIKANVSNPTIKTKKQKKRKTGKNKTKQFVKLKDYERKISFLQMS